MSYETKDVAKAALWVIFALVAFGVGTNLPNGFSIWPLNAMSPDQIIGAVLIGLFVFVALPVLYYMGAEAKPRKPRR